MGAENLPPNSIPTLDRPNCSESLYRLSYPGPLLYIIFMYFVYFLLSNSYVPHSWSSILAIVISAVWCLRAVKFTLPFALHTVDILMGVSTGWIHAARWPCKDRRSRMSASFLCIILSGFASSQQGAARRRIYSVRTRHGVETGDERGESWGLSGRVEIDINCRYSATLVPCGGNLPLPLKYW